MSQNDIHRANAVRHMSVDAGIRTADRADSHGHRPQNKLTCSAEQVEEAEIDAAIAEHEAWKAAGLEVAPGVHGRGVRRLPVRITWSQIAQATFVRFLPTRPR